MGFQPKLAIQIGLTVLTLSGSARAFQENTLEPLSIPENLVVDLRVFEVRRTNLDKDAFESMSSVIDNDGRLVNANQWLAAVADRIPGAFVAALAYETRRARGGTARFVWTHRARSFHVDMDLSSYHPDDRFESKCRITWKRSDETLREFEELVPVERGQTTVWSAQELEVGLRDYLSNFRSYEDREHRGLLFEKLQTKNIHLILVTTLRLLAEDEVGQLSPEKLEKPTDEPMPEFDNPLGVPLMGTVVVGFEIDASGAPLNPQIVWSSVPEANPRIMGEVALWRFPAAAGRPNEPGRRWGQVELEINIP